MVLPTTVDAQLLCGRRKRRLSSHYRYEFLIAAKQQNVKRYYSTVRRQLSWRETSNEYLLIDHA
jgi:hypothetical protein